VGRNPIALDLAAFLDSREARALPAPGREEVRRIAEAFLAACYDDLGKKPRLLDGEDVRAILERSMPGRMRARDPLAEHVPAVLAAYLDHLEAREVVAQAWEIRRALEETIEPFLESVRTGENVRHAVAVRQDPFVHRASKLGRNDPCSCGSGKKYKKCHGRTPP